METERTPTIIEARELTIGYTHKRHASVLFQNLNLQLKSGALTCFMGPNGIGKSTLIRTFLGLHKPLSGDLRYAFDGALVEYEKIQNRARHVSAVLTDRIFAMNLNASELVAFGRYPYLGWDTKLNSADERMVNQSIAHVQIQHLADRKISELSDGQLQMVMIARALAQDTPIILLDEPTAHLDLNNRLEIMNLLRKLSHTLNKAILVATHELDLALQTADIVWLAGHNQDIQTGIPEDLVLNGAFDDVFRFKGFDLRTGKVDHEAYRNTTINLIGIGHAYLWTRNALERNGFSLVDRDASIAISITIQDDVMYWNRDSHQFNSISDLLANLNQVPAGKGA